MVASNLSEVDDNHQDAPQAHLLNENDVPLLASEDAEEEEFEEEEEYEEKTRTASVLGKKGFGYSSNQLILTVTAAMFLLFVVAEIIGALTSHSLSLLADAASMVIDVLTYFTNMYAERAKSNGKVLSPEKKLLLQAGIPLLSVASLVGVTIWISIDAVKVLLEPSADGDDVDIYVMYGFAAANFVIDLISVAMFFANKERAMYDDHSRSVSIAGVPGATSAAAAASASATAVEHAEEVRGSYDGAANAPKAAGSGDTETGALATATAVDEEKGEASGVVNGSSVSAKPRLGSDNAAVLKCNVNMLSALSHVSADTLRTFAIFAGAGAASAGVNSVVADAWAALVCSVTIVVAIVPLVREIYDVIRDYRDPSKRYRRHYSRRAAGQLSTTTSTTTISTQAI